MGDIGDIGIGDTGEPGSLRADIGGGEGAYGEAGRNGTGEGDGGIRPPPILLGGCGGGCWPDILLSVLLLLLHGREMKVETGQPAGVGSQANITSPLPLLFC